MAKSDRKSEDEERPWTEAQWAAFMREGEARAARMGEILETVIDQPDRWEIVAREMGWQLAKDEDDFLDTENDSDEPRKAKAFIIEESDDEVDEADDADVDEPGDDDFDIEQQDREIEAIPAYAKAMTLSDKIDKVLDPILKDKREIDEEVGEIVGDAFIQIKIVCAKISGGHAMGYEDEVLCGNIVCNTIARDAVNKCGRALEELIERKVFTKKMIAPLLQELIGVKKAVDDRIAEMRAKVWW